jgi:hypothetical protein
MSDELAAEIQKKLTAAGVATRRADADEDADANGKKLDRLLSFLDDLKTKFGARLDALEARGGGADDDEGDEDDNEMEQPGKPRRVAADQADAVRRHEARMADAQARADAVAAVFGERAPHPLSGETLHAYVSSVAKGIAERFAD